MHLKYYFIFFLIFLVSCGKDKNLANGKVTDVNAKALDSVLVQVMSTDLFTYTNENGKFELDTKGRGEEIIFNKEGFEFARISVEELPQTILLMKK